MNELYDRQRAESVLTRVGVPKDRRNAILDEIHFPIELDALEAIVAPLGITRDALISRLGGSP